MVTYTFGSMSIYPIMDVNYGGRGLVTPTVIKTSQYKPLDPLKWVETSNTKAKVMP